MKGTPEEESETVRRQIRSWYAQWMLVDRLYDEFAQSHGLSGSAMAVLRALWERGTGCTQHTLCTLLNLPKQTVSSVLKGLEEHGCAAQAPLETDKRSKTISLTAKGEQVVRQFTMELSRIEESAFRSLPVRDREIFTQVNEALTRALHAQIHREKSTDARKEENDGGTS